MSSSLTNRRVTTTILLLLALLYVVAVPSAARADTTAPKPTIVLVHGAWDRAQSWADTAARLRADGYAVIAPELPLRSLAGDTGALRRTLDEIAGPIVIAGHSYGGAVASGAAIGDPRVRALVFIAAFAPDTGESILQLGAHDVGSLIPVSLLSVPFLGPDGLGVNLYINPLLYRTVYAADVPLTTAQAMARDQHPLTLKAFTDPSGTPAWRSIPSWYLIARQDHALPPAAQRFMAARAGSHTIEIDSSHAAPVSHPREVAGLIFAAATG